MHQFDFYRYQILLANLFQWHTKPCICLETPKCELLPDGGTGAVLHWYGWTLVVHFSASYVFIGWRTIREKMDVESKKFHCIKWTEKLNCVRDHGCSPWWEICNARHWDDCFYLHLYLNQSYWFRQDTKQCCDCRGVAGRRRRGGGGNSGYAPLWLDTSMFPTLIL